MVSVSYGPGTLNDGVMTLEDGIHGVMFHVSQANINLGAAAFEARLFAPAMVALERRVAKANRPTDFPTISFNNVVSS